MKGPAFNQDKVKLIMLKGKCGHKSKYSKRCGTTLKLHTWDLRDPVVRCPNCGNVCRVEA